MKASKDWGPCSECDEQIVKGELFTIKEGDFIHERCIPDSKRVRESEKK